MSICSESISNLKNIKKDRASLDKMVADFDNAKDSSNREVVIENLRAIFSQRKKLRLEIKEAIPIEVEFVVENAKNSYAEALKDGGVTDPELIAERKDINIDLGKILKQDREAYKSAGCNIWADALPENIKELNLTHKQIEIIKSRVELGEIIIVMPGRLAQLNGLMQAIKKLKPKFVKDGEEQTVSETYHWDYIDSLIEIMKEIADGITSSRWLIATETAKLSERLDPLIKDKDGVTGFSQLYQAVASLPAHPYICTASINKQNPPETGGVTVNDQISELKAIQGIYRELNLSDQSIGEWLALQNRFTERVKEQADEKLNSLIPLDDCSHSRGTYYRCIGLPVSLDGHVPGIYWDTVNSLVNLNTDGGFISRQGGFRTSVRV